MFVRQGIVRNSDESAAQAQLTTNIIVISFRYRWTNSGGAGMNALQQRFAGLWLIVGIGVGTAVGVATGFASIGLALGTLGGIVAGALVGHRRG
jgi:hypothetical protein